MNLDIDLSPKPSERRRVDCLILVPKTENRELAEPCCFRASACRTVQKKKKIVSKLLNLCNKFIC
jgi:hypothetical protein